MIASRTLTPAAALATLASAVFVPADSDATLVDRTVYCEEFGSVSSPFCPDAREALSLLEQNYGTDQILHVEWHVSETFNNPDAEILQSFYGGTPGLPTVVFDGQNEIVGGGLNMYPLYESQFLSDRAAQSKLIMSGHVFVPASGLGSFAVDLEVASGELVGAPHTVKVILYEDDVLHGGVRWDRIGRSIAHVEPLTIVNGGEMQTVSATFPIDPFDQGWNATNCRAIAYVQRDNNWKIIQSASCSLAYDLEVTNLGPVAEEVPVGQTGAMNAQVEYAGVVSDDVWLALDKSDLPAGWDAVVVWSGGSSGSGVTIPAMTPGQVEPYQVRIIPSADPGVGRVTVSAEPASNPVQGEEHAYYLFAGTPPVLLVDDDRGATSEVEFEQAVLDAGYFAGVHDIQASGSPPAAVLSSFEVVIWTTGELQTGTLLDLAEGNLGAYLDGGGRLFLSSQGFLNDRGTDPFAQSYLGVTSFLPDVQAPGAVGVGGDPIGDGLNLTLSPPFPDAADEITGTAGGAVGWLDGAMGSNPVGVRVEGEAFRSVFMSAAFDGISTSAPDPDNQAVVMRRILDWLGEPGPGLDVPASVMAGPDGSFAYEWAFTVGPGGIFVAAFGATGIENASAGFVADCFCLENCHLEEGHELRQTVTGVLTDPGAEGLVENWMTSCQSGTVSAMTRILPVVATPAEAIPRAVSTALSVQPNPFRGSLQLTIDLERSSGVVVEVLDVTGRRVRKLFAGALPAGPSTFSWDGRGAPAGPRASGIYFVRLTTDRGVERTHKVTLLR